VIAKGGVTVIHAILFAVLVVALSLSGPGQGRAAGKDFVIGLSGDATSLNPVIATDSMSYTVEWPVFDSLVELDQKLTVRPLLAESWETSKDGLTYTFKLKKGVGAYRMSMQCSALQMALFCLVRSALVLSARGPVVQQYFRRVAL